MNNFDVVKRKKKFDSSYENHGDIIGGTSFKKTNFSDNKKTNHVKRMGYKNGLESQEQKKPSKKIVPSKKNSINGDSIVNPKGIIEKPTSGRRRLSVGVNDTTKESSTYISKPKKMFATKDQPKEMWVYDPSTASDFYKRPSTSKKMTKRKTTDIFSKAKDGTVEPLISSSRKGRTNPIVLPPKAAPSSPSAKRNKSSSQVSNVLSWE
mmetsp:Transcript_13908/g.21047  ORF Transcript_13908/g.21047 Transcript_13908/m.21047 type:complete len:208 (-) Transcript_13908:34-657(-)